MRSGLLLAQAILIAVCALVIAGLKGPASIPSALFGGAVALISGLLLSVRVSKAQQQLTRDPLDDVRSLVFGAAQRFVLTLGLLVLGLGYLKLDPLSLVATFAVAQLGFAFAGAQQKVAGR